MRLFVGHSDLGRLRNCIGLQFVTVFTVNACYCAWPFARAAAGADHLHESRHVMPGFLTHCGADRKKNFERFGPAIHHASVNPLFTFAYARVNRLLLQEGNRG